MLNEDVLIAPSVLSADFTKLGAELDAVRDADLVHYDVMDGHFVPNLSYGTAILKQVKAATKLPLDVHLMVSNPEVQVPWFLEAGADIISFHLEAATHANRLCAQIREAGAQAAVALNPATPVCLLDSVIEDVDLVLVMTVNPGFGGQSFIPNSVQKVRKLSELCREHGVSPAIEVDGGIGVGNARDIVEAGANVLVAGSSVFKLQDRAQAIAGLRAQGRLGLEARR